MNIRNILLIVLVVIALSGCKSKSRRDLTRFVDPFIGTAYAGHTHPDAQLPFGMVQLGPDTGTDTWEHCSGYCDADSSIIGFSHTHLSGTGCPDMGDIMFMPVTGNVSFYQGDSEKPSAGYRSRFSHKSEEAHPGYYKVFLEDYDIKAELTATERTGFQKYTFPESDHAGIIIDLVHGIGDTVKESSITLINDTVVVGKRRSSGFIKDHTWFFYAVLSKPVEQVTSFADSLISSRRDILGRNTKMLLQFKTRKEETVMVRVALSTVSIEGAKKNLYAESGGWNFDNVREHAAFVWNSFLKRIEIKPRNNEERISFYTALYHTLLAPNEITDVNGIYGLPDGTAVKADGNRYTNFSLWDTYRASHPFFVLCFPDKNALFVKSMTDIYKRRGVLCTNEYGENETWCMIGNHAVSVIADAYIKGILKENTELAAEAIYKSLTTSHPKSNWTVYDKYGYYPFDLVPIESVSRTMEHCYDDYCAALMARMMRDTIMESFFKKRSENFRNLFDPSIKLMRAKDSNGKWRPHFNSFSLSHASTNGGDYTEGNAWQYTWHIQHNIPELIKMMGSKDYFEAKLDSLFFLNVHTTEKGFHGDVTGMIGQYAHGNEPSHHIAYLYDYTDHPYKTQEIIRQIFDKFYSPKRDGLSGNDDCGQMSAWYIFSALGFYPVDPISGLYLIGAPQAKELKLFLPNGKIFTVKALGISDKNRYVKSVKLNGEILKSFTVSYDDIMNGGRLEFEMTNKRTSWLTFKVD
jgi:predicted alpha-1,2-mannosidase